MLMMRLQRVGRRNDPAYRIVVTDKRTGVNSDKHVARLGSYNPKLGHIQLDTAAAKDWLANGVQASGTMHNILVSQGVLDAKKINVLPKKSPIIDEEAIKKAADEAAAKAEADKVNAEDGEGPLGEKAAAEAEAAPEAESAEEASAEETPAEEAATEEPAAEAEETPAKDK